MKFIESELAYKLTYKDIVDIIKIIDDASCHELQIELEDLKLKIIKGDTHGSAPIAKSAVVPPVHAVSEPRNRTAAEQPLTKSKHKTEMKPVHSEDASNIKKETAGEEKINGVPILSPLAGMFYCASEPGAKPFVEIGARVEKGQQVGIVEVMKLMTNIKAPENGVIREIRVKNEETVGMGQILMTIDPS
jgi:acetyl-CoA carboxylase biotin carboxyl carrier protein